MKSFTASSLLAVFGLASLAIALPRTVARAQSATNGGSSVKTPQGGQTVPFSQAGKAQTAPARSQAAPAGQIAGAGSTNVRVPGQTVTFGAPTVAQDGMPVPAPMQPMPPMAGGSPATMVVNGGYLYILQGNRLFKVSTDDLSVVREGQLPAFPPRGRYEGGAELAPSVTEPAPRARRGGGG